MVLVLFQIIEVLFQHCKLKCPIKMTKYNISIMQRHVEKNYSKYYFRLCGYWNISNTQESISVLAISIWDTQWRNIMQNMAYMP